MRLRTSTALALLISTTACAQTVESDDLLEDLRDSGAGVTQIIIEERDPSSSLPNSYRDHYSFTIEEVAPKGGQVFVCDSKKYCDALMTYFEQFPALVGPYLYQSKSGKVVAQLNSGLSPHNAEVIESILQSY
ncbi:hypothetical protein [Larsenimonas rhizosphaerae]|uniref:hypothetical protein n=1 Tax=Larsenimonas rhizosphaerae TaxID=2944682 RepID=UPI002033856F|nr:hypothetical protein [Larsenimonas rhizosphaerae]MCM2131444.1 hypothetical protein [Larsenimonas rhizosphaerae]